MCDTRVTRIRVTTHLWNQYRGLVKDVAAHRHVQGHIRIMTLRLVRVVGPWQQTELVEEASTLEIHVFLRRRRQQQTSEQMRELLSLSGVTSYMKPNPHPKSRKMRTENVSCRRVIALFEWRQARKRIMMQQRIGRHWT